MQTSTTPLHLNKTQKQNKEQNNEYVVITARKKSKEKEVRNECEKTCEKTGGKREQRLKTHQNVLSVVSTHF